MSAAPTELVLVALEAVASVAGMAVRGTFLVGRDGRVVWSGVNEQGQRRDFARVRAEVAALDRI